MSQLIVLNRSNINCFKVDKDKLILLLLTNKICSLALVPQNGFFLSTKIGFLIRFIFKSCLCQVSFDFG